jgi:hypothetical protein
MAPDRYTELFFLDEATGLAAGHRPCAECQRTRFNEIRQAWSGGRFQAQSLGKPTAVEIDERLHAERLHAAGSKRTFTSHLDDLPHGVFVTLEEHKDQAFLIHGDSLHVWSPGGYRERLNRTNRGVVSVLTPATSMAAIRAGFVPQVHTSLSRES